MKDFKIITIAYTIFICSIIGFSSTKSISYSDSALDYGQYILPNLNVYLPYKWQQKGIQVANLQIALGIKVTGIYNEQTRNYHYSYLKYVGAPTSNIPQIPQTTPNPTNDLICQASAARIFAHQILDPYNIPIPSITAIANARSTFYGPGSTAIFMPPCAEKSAIVHEIGHYVHARAFGLNWESATRDAAINFTSSDWIKAEEISPGIEHAAHCIGNVLWGYGPYTKCPDPVMKSYAAKIITQAG